MTLVFAMLTLLLPATPPAADPSAPVDDAAWLQSKGILLFHDAFGRAEDGNGLKAIGNGWENATADRVPRIKQARIENGILKVTSATREAAHGAHIHHDAGFADGGVTLRFRLPGLNKDESLTVGFVDRELKHVHAGHLCYAHLFEGSIKLIDNKTGISDEDVRMRRQVFLDRKEPLPPDLDTLLKTKEISIPWKADTEWHDLLLATEGDEMRLTIDGKLVARHRSAGFSHPMKRWLSFGIPSTAWIADVKVWKVK